jgi:F420H(2)-dependent quinone reductase
MAKYVPSPHDWVREQVELYESSGGTKGTTLRDTGLPVVTVTHRGNRTGAIRKNLCCVSRSYSPHACCWRVLCRNSERCGNARVAMGC